MRNFQFCVWALLATGLSSAALGAEAVGVQLPYKIYLSSTFTGWGQNEQNELKYDSARQMYVMQHVRLGPHSAAEPRRFKITGANWQHQFGLVANNSSTDASESTLAFVHGRATIGLTHFKDMKDIFIPSVDAPLLESGDVMADFELKVSNTNNNPIGELTVVEDLPPLGGKITVLANMTSPTIATYEGHGQYRVGLNLKAGSNSISVANENKQYFQLQPERNGGYKLSPCPQQCESRISIDEAYVYGVSIGARSNDLADVKIQKLSKEDAKALAPHFDAKGKVASKFFKPNAKEPGGREEQVAVSVLAEKDGIRTFTLTSTQQQRDDKEKYRVVKEDASFPRVHTQNILFDALFSMAIDDMKLDSVSAIRDGNYNNGESIPCECFETGEKWNYVWTRDLSYAANLGLAQFDVNRVIKSMEFKISDFREGVAIPENIPKGSLQVIQDTGSGGSWPVSTDRVTWSLAASSVLNNLSGEARDAFATKAYAALRGTIEADRLAAYDSKMGLYGGEQSYLDWRTQTYAPWIVNNLSRMSESKALSTNIVHYHALKLAASLAKTKNDSENADKYLAWANELAERINATFWLEDVGLYATITSSAEDPSSVYKYDLLGNSLAILSGVADTRKAQRIIESYPNTPMGMPVYYPQQPNVYVYHNRSMWPFVTAYAIKAAIRAKNDKVAVNNIRSLVRGSALHLSNMENLEWLTGKSFYDDGPAINSRRQLWSVGAYLGVVTESIFGVEVVEDGLEIKPFLTPEIIQLLGGGKSAFLSNYRYKDHLIDIQLDLPAVSGTGIYPVRQVALNGKVIEKSLKDGLLRPGKNEIVVKFGEAVPSTSGIRLLTDINPVSHDDPEVFSPEAPEKVQLSYQNGGVLLNFEATHNSTEAEKTFNIYKNGKVVARGLTDTHWLDPHVPVADARACYSVEAEYTNSRNRSHHSEPVCIDGKSQQFIAVTDKRVRSNMKVTKPSENYAKPVLLEWGAPEDSLAIQSIEIAEPGLYAIQIIYNNRQHTIDSGVTNAVKMLTIHSEKGQKVGESVIQMPNVKDAGNVYPLVTSTEAKVRLEKGLYNIQLSDYFNMSYLVTNASYKGNGGFSGPVNKASIAGVKLVRTE
jgi:hypothetical protein